VRKLAAADAALQEATLRGASDAELQMLESNVTDKKNKYSKTKWGTLTSTLILGEADMKCIQSLTSNRRATVECISNSVVRFRCFASKI
jgi:hypothetical protein